MIEIISQSDDDLDNRNIQHFLNFSKPFFQIFKHFILQMCLVFHSILFRIL